VNMSILASKIEVFQMFSKIQHGSLHKNGTNN
jgi:hypothetical protein